MNSKTSFIKLTKVRQYSQPALISKVFYFFALKSNNPTPDNVYYVNLDNRTATDQQPRDQQQSINQSTNSRQNSKETSRTAEKPEHARMIKGTQAGTQTHARTHTRRHAGEPARAGTPYISLKYIIITAHM